MLVPFLCSWRTKVGGLLPLRATCPPRRWAPLLSRAPLWWGPPSWPPLLVFLVAAGRSRSSDHFPSVCSTPSPALSQRWAHHSVRSGHSHAWWPCAKRALAMPTGLGRPKAWPLASQAGLGLVNPVAVGLVRFFFFSLDYFKSNEIQFNFEFGLNSRNFCINFRN
jgi:hypothetical protein